MSLQRIVTRFAIGVRIYAGFAIVLALLVAVAAVGYLGLAGTEQRLAEYRSVADNALQATEAERDFGEMRRQALAFADSGDEAAARRARELAQEIRGETDRAIGAVKSEDVRQLLRDFAEHVDEYAKSLEHLVKARQARDVAVNQEMNVHGAAARQKLTQIIQSAMADGDYEAAALAGMAQERLSLGRINALRFLDQPERKNADAARQEIQEFQRSATTLEARLQNPTRKQLAGEALALSGKYATAFGQVVQAVDQYHALVSETMRSSAEEAMAHAGELVELQRRRLGQVAEEASAGIADTQKFGLVSSALAFALGGLLAWLISAGITRPVKAMTETMEKLAAGDKTVAIPATENRDEIGAMAKTVQVFKDNALRVDALQREQEEAKAHAEADKKRAMASLAQEFEAAIGGIVRALSGSASEMQAAAQTMSATAAQTSHQAIAVAAASEQATANVGTVATAGEELSSSIAEIGRQVGQSTRIAGQAVDQAKATDAKVQGLVEAAQRIGDVVKLINDIAGQTNLLALNATIEAARAGEAGKGFAVVASEVKSLANQTAKATDEIAAQINAIQGATKESVAAIQSIGQTIAQVSEIATTIAAAVEQQGAATSEIARNVQQAAKGTQEVTTNIGDVNRAATATGAAASQVLAAAGALSQQSDALRAQVDAFLAKVRTA